MRLKTRFFAAFGMIALLVTSTLLACNFFQPLAYADWASTYGGISGKVPTFSPAPGDYNQSVEVSLDASGDTIYYTTDGTDPTLSSTIYSASSPINLTSSTTLKAMSFTQGVTSSIATAEYNVFDWKNVGTEGGVAVATTLALSMELLNDVPYILYRNAGSVQPRKFNGTTWVNATTSTTGDKMATSVAGSTLLLAFEKDGINLGEVWTLNNDSWGTLSGQFRNGGDSSIQADEDSVGIHYNGTRYTVAYVTDPTKDINVRDTDGTSGWTNIGIVTGGSSNVKLGGVVRTSEGIYVATSYGAGTIVGGVYKAPGVAVFGTGLGASNIENGTFRIAGGSGTRVWVAFGDKANGGGVTVKTIDTNGGTAWTTLGDPGFNGNAVNYVALAVHDDIPYVAFNRTGVKLSVYKWDEGENEWTVVGSPGLSQGLTSMITLRFNSDGEPWICYRDASAADNVTVKAYGEVTD
jgi:hypothetical protein